MARSYAPPIEAEAEEEVIVSVVRVFSSSHPPMVRVIPG